MNPVQLHCAFLDALEKNCQDKISRLQYADFLDENDCPEHAQKQRTMAESLEMSWQESHEWVESLAASVGRSYKDLMEFGNHLAEGGSAHLGFGDDDGPSEMRASLKDFCLHWQVLTGRAMPPDASERASFSCAC